MSDVIKDYEDECGEIITQVTTLLTKDIPKLQGRNRMDKCDFVKKRIDRARQVLKSFNIELRELPRAEAKPWEEKSRNFEQQIKKLEEDLTWAMSSAERDELISNKPRNADEMTSRQLVDQAKTVQEESKAATSRIKDNLQVTIDIGQATNKTLKDQTEQIGRVDAQLDALESNLQRADKQIRIFLRRMATDKVILMLVAMVIFAIIASVVVAVVNARQNGTTVQGPSDVFGTPDTTSISNTFFGGN